MLELSLYGLIGAMLGTAAAALCYGPLAALMERSLRARRDGPLADELPLLRRGVLALDLLVFAGLGYWVGALIEG
jgi:hypothetical protein